MPKKYRKPTTGLFCQAAAALTGALLATAAAVAATPATPACPGGAAKATASLPLRVDAAQRGVWVATPEHTRFFDSRAELERQLEEFQRLGINTVYAAMFNQGRTLYPSAVMHRLTGVTINERARGRDPLQELVEVARGKGIKVYAWFEFGFVSDFKGGLGAEIIKARPHWAALDKDGRPVEKNGFRWMNALDREVQDFALDLIMEVVQRYDVDGIQGDDRLPAMASEGGYNPETVTRYKKAHGGKSPPLDSKDPQWLAWRAAQLNDFMHRLHDAVKAAKPKLQISMSPSPYPWGYDEYLQDWPTWLRKGWVDSVSPQLYRYNIEGYQTELRKLAREQLCPADRAKVFPGLLLALGNSYVVPAELLRQMVEENRREGIGGEVYFHSEGLKPRADTLRQLYAR
ncbi:glycoside hydrolase family 10 protein [Roseateles violae]|uniref:Family 10 glycosylhydrolase n=1 Tax=Roseateles violae TaxID=3058042 RepID=A0ABT8DTG1_9BURK|nr:family 10 glycosylhydrolase [Pelomonas sp. PFR6]MDN3920338.1 family 10 glycosylhydrolase [Pelomonas sp. PFR6]